jgi:diaminopimelate epimerase
MNFYKYEATGNDFIIINRPYSPEITQKWIHKLCDRHYGIGSDGLFFMWLDDSHWKWKFFNNDGSPANFCGNAARCAVLWLHNQIDRTREDWEWNDGKQIFRGQIKSQIKNKIIEVRWPKAELKQLELKSHHQSLIKQLHDLGVEKAFWVQAGVPHLVLIGSSWPRKIRHLFYANHLVHHPDFTKESNISWLSRTDMTLVSYERGLEAESLACGSGALSAFYALLLLSKEDKNLRIPPSLTFTFPGGPLTVTESGEYLTLAGPAHKVFEGYYEES